MKWILVLIYCVVNSFPSRADGQVQLTVDVAGEAKTSVNIRPDCPQGVSLNEIFQRKKRAAPPIRPFSVETGPGSAPSASGSMGSSDYSTMVGDQSSFQPAPAPGPASARQPGGGMGSMGSGGSGGMGGSGFGGSGMGGGGMGGMRGGGMGGPPFGGPNGGRGSRNDRYRGEGRRCRGPNSNGPGCRRQRGDFGRRGHRRPNYDDYGGGGYDRGRPGSRGPRNQMNQRMGNPRGASGSTTASSDDYSY
ncbi:keratin, type II cytoskeletal 2 epidermal-like [Lutzomyia longipalpis]|uniref:keratin, type II cytoskeletal 2 epidermal-like n=1 Tax=Lutzomyia longipalpis TaxID=7200 RepID=UPI002483482D|nr:keratin, type II cytoskeletal 2 epidermal-like [Lutzomyia longipalpis]